jgi:hypothetical protein
MGTTTGFTSISPSGPDGAYVLTPNTTYTGSLAIARTSATEMQLTGTLGSATHTVTDTFDSANFGMLAFWANSNIFGTSATPGEANNGIDFSNVRIEVIPVPEPGTAILATMVATAAGASTALRRRARRVTSVPRLQCVSRAFALSSFRDSLDLDRESTTAR